MEIKSAHGKHRILVAEENRAKVKTFFADNPDCSIADCQRQLNLTYITVRKHIDAINSEE